MGSVAEWAAAIASFFAFLAATAAVRAANSTERRERVQRTIDMVDRHRAVVKEHWTPLTDAQKWSVHLLDWSARDRTAEMKAILEMLNSGERLGEAWRADSLDTATLIRLESGSGERYIYLSRYAFPAIRQRLGYSEAFDAFESLLCRCYERLAPNDRSRAAARLVERLGPPTIES
jgi:hypothetical protein